MTVSIEGFIESFRAKAARVPDQVFARFNGEPLTFERLDALSGNLSLFVRRDEQEQAWRWVEPIMDTWAEQDIAPKTYASGTWGPPAANALVARDGHNWHEEL